ncbi:MAG TPA: hypothetical protein VLE22_05955 [Bryobacteraceae bacterium]|nr:hypothetical protein [Bryobacteraceae bacterium]
MKPPVLLRCLLAAFVLPAVLGAAIDLENELVVRWPRVDDESAKLLKELGVKVVIVPRSENQPAGEVHRVCRRAGLTPALEIGHFERWEEIEKEFAQAMTDGFRVVVFEAIENSADRIRELAATHGDAGVLALLKPEWAGWQVAPAIAVLNDGRWPGLEARDPTVASASEAPWINANCHLFGYLRGMFPERPAALSYLPDEKAGVKKSQVVHFESVELSLAEAMAGGGNVLLAFPESYRTALAAKETKALEAWRSLRETAVLLRAHRDRFRQPLSQDVVVAGGDLDQTGEILNMFFRRNLSPRSRPVSRLSPASVSAGRVLVVVNIAPPPPPARAAITTFAKNGGVVLLAPAANGDKAWWTSADPPAAHESERDVYAVGKGRVAVYNEPVIDSAEFAWDVIDSLGSVNLDLRIWNAPTVIGLVRRQKDGAAVVALLNYGSPLTMQEDDEILMRIRGTFTRVELSLPGKPAPAPLKATKRGGTTEVEVRGLERIAVVSFQ